MAFKLLNKKPEVEPMVEQIKQEVSKPVEPREVIEVVLKIPTQEIRRARREDGTIVNYITADEFALMKMTREANEGN